MADRMTDEQLLASFARGDRSGRGALGALAERYERGLLGFARGRLGSEDLACEAVQEAWVRVIRHAGSFKGRSTFKTWMYKIVINRCNEIRSEVKRMGRGREAAIPMDAAARVVVGEETGVSVGELNGTLKKAVEELEERKRMVVLLCYHEGITHESAAEILGVPLGTVKSRLNAALSELRGKLVEEAVR